MPKALKERWAKVMKEEYEALVHAVEWDKETFLDPYGATEETEFFAVVTEAFFDHPLGLRERHPELYRLFEEFYRLSPAAWFEG
jgi:MtfA peptidase